MRSPKIRYHSLAATTLAFFLALQPARADRVLSGCVPAATRTLAPLGDMSPENRLQLALGLPVRDQQALNTFLREVSDPASPNFRHYLTPDQFTEMFGPTEQDYETVIEFARSHNLAVVAVHPNRLVLDVSGTVAEVQKAFHVILRNYQHPTEPRLFHAPDREPSVDQTVPILHIAGLENYALPHPNLRIRPLDLNTVSPRSGSGPSGTFRGNDFRAAYLPGISLTGAGQSVALLEFDGYNPNDIATYEQTSGLSSVPLQNVLVDGYSGAAHSGNGEVCLDIELAIAMAPGLSKVIVYEAPGWANWEDILSPMANDNLAKQLSCSWGGGPPDSTAEEIFQQMAAQGQTFFDATGDDDAYTGEIPYPADSPNIIQVGGTSLSIMAGGLWLSETTWNWGYNHGSYTGSSGGFSTFYPRPSWQQHLNVSTNQGSTSFRNFPDVAMVADDVYEVSDNGQGSNAGGTSCSAPLWAGFAALVNQQAANNGQPPIGFINPALYAIGQASNYASIFHDITTGNNITNHSSGRFSAVAGFDLCTGWGTPSAALIWALASPGSSGPTTTNYTISASANPIESGTISGAGSYPSGSQITLIAVLNSGYIFTNWTENGNVVSTSASYTFTVTGDRSLLANFSRKTSYNVSLIASPIQGGKVYGSGISTAGSTRTVSAIPKNKYVFSDWTENGVVVSTSQNYTFVLNNDRFLTAEFERRAGKKRRGRKDKAGEESAPGQGANDESGPVVPEENRTR